MNHHKFSLTELKQVRKSLLSWYDINKRDLPWRQRAVDPSSTPTERAYAVWVSEVMLQQTQVATVINYYNRWMKKWPTVNDLAKASLDEVNEMWSGLGYYSRGRRLLEGAQKVVSKFNGELPKSAKSLMKELPGVGKYTSCAIASIAHGEVTGLVDGNVIRVFSRLRCIGSNVASQSTVDFLWELANESVDDERPGDFNQALMELGATVCIPRQPLCEKCPLSGICSAKRELKYRLTEKKSNFGNNEIKHEVIDIEDDCQFCLPKQLSYDTSIGVMHYPQKLKKKASREEYYSVVIIQCEKEKEKCYLLKKRPAKGLLASMWELVNVEREPDDSLNAEKASMFAHLNDQYHIDKNDIKSSEQIGEITHVFSHIQHYYHVWKVQISNCDCVTPSQTVKWLNKDELLSCGITTAVRKCLKLDEQNSGANNEKSSLKRKRSSGSDDKGQSRIDSMFTRLKK